MRKIMAFSIPAVLAAVLLTGCGSTGMGDVLGGGRTTDRTSDTGRYDPYNQQTGDVQGTVERVSTRDRYIAIDPEGDNSRYNLRNGSGNDEVIVYFDDRTPVEYQGRTFQPADLEPGDRVRVNIERSGDRLMAEQIQVLYDATGGTGDRYSDRNNDPYNNDTYNNNGTDNRYNDLRGTVRNVDTRNRTVEVERTQSGTLGRGDIVLVRYDANTTVEYQGRRYAPENLERGDVVEITTRDGSGGSLLAQQIVVVGENGTAGR
ncbi:MAG: DUF5666 domain-containing protein [Thermoanaerobaculia bacterium]